MSRSVSEYQLPNNQDMNFPPFRHFITKVEFNSNISPP